MSNARQEPSRPAGRQRIPTQRVKTPTVLQMEDTECGAAALAMVLKYFGKNVSLEQLREACSTSRDGVNALNIVEAARTFGLAAKGVRYTYNSLYRLDLPIIVFWNFNHFLVVEGISFRRVWINDPAVGRRSMDWEEFRSGYSGVALSFEPTEEFVADPKPPVAQSDWRYLLEISRGSTSGIVFIGLAGLAVVVPSTAAALVSALFVERVLGYRELSWVGILVFVSVVILVLNAGLSLLQQRMMLRLTTKLAVRSTAGFLWHLLRLPATFFQARSPGGLVSRIGLNNTVSQHVASTLAGAAIAVLNMLLYLIVLMVLNPTIAAVALVLAVLNVLILLGITRTRHTRNMSMQQYETRLTSFTYVGVHLADSIRATGEDREYFRRWSGLHAAAIGKTQAHGQLAGFFGIVPGLVAALATVAILIVGGFQVLDDQLSVGALVGIQAIAASFLGPVGQLVASAASLSDLRASLAQIADVRRAATMPNATFTDQAMPVAVEADPAAGSSPSARQPMTSLVGRVEFDNVTFGFSRSQPPLFQNLSFVVEPGQRVAIVGPSGSGKSTLAALLAGELQPWSGRILIDGMPRDQIPAPVLGQTLSKVDQQVRLFKGTVEENIRLWDDSIPSHRVVAAARDAAIAEEIASRPGGYGYELTEGSGNLSGGQRQRIEIARALAVDPVILVMDEATSALDAVSEYQIDRRIRRRGITCLIVSHRLSTVRDADRIVVLRDGEIVESGIHSELLARQGVYAELMSA